MLNYFSNSWGGRKLTISHQPFKITSAPDGEKLVWGETVIKLEFYITIFGGYYIYNNSYIMNIYSLIKLSLKERKRIQE